MEKIKQDQIVIINDDGDEFLCNILFTHETDDGRNFIVFENVRTHDIGAAEYVENPETPGEGSLEDIVRDADWALIETLYEAYIADEQDASL